MVILSENPSDVVLLVLAFCDVASVLAVSQTCKRLQTLAFEKSVWISLCRDLQHRQMLDCVLTPELSAGPNSWKTGRAPTIQREITLPLQAQAQGSRTSARYYSRDEVLLLPDGRHILFTQSGTLTCWDVVSQNRIWKHVPSADAARSYVVHVAAAKVSRDVLRILAANQVAAGGGDNSNYVEIIELDLQTGIDRLLLVTRIWGKSPVDAFESGVISGTRPVAAISFTTYYSTSRAIFFDFTSVDEPKVLQIQCYVNAVGLTERHIYVCCDQESESNIESDKKPRYDSTLRVFAVDSLADFCGPACPALGSETPRSILLDHLPGIAALNLGPRAVGAISVLASPLRDHHYRVWINTVTNTVVNPVVPDSTSLYRLVDSDSQLHFEKLQSYEHEERVNLNGNSAYSGHALSQGRPPHLKAYLSMPSSRRYVLNENVDRSWWRMSSYSGAVAYYAHTSNSIVVKYYE
ncbi:hypothetical protein C8F01DRAFT_1177622 [Mycena amicta]|nr:hypothetical protein C8F01DRAFT_1177622 [Mycena amicta]